MPFCRKKAKTGNSKLDHLYAVGAGIEEFRDELVDATIHPIETLQGTVTTIWDGLNAISDATLGLSDPNAKARNARRGTALVGEWMDGDSESIGFKYTGGSGDGKYCKFIHTELGFSVRIDDVHPPKRSNGCKYQHIHLFDKQGNSLNADLKIVPTSSPDAHIKVSEFIKPLELKL